MFKDQGTEEGLEKETEKDPPATYKETKNVLLSPRSLVKGKK